MAMFEYQIVKANPPINSSDFVLRINLENGEVSSIPMVETNADYMDYLSWCAEANTAEEQNPDAITEPVVEPTAEPETTESVES